MATAFINTGFQLVKNDGSVPPFLWGETFTPNLVTLSIGGFGAFTNAYSGSFEQATDGTITGTITGVSGLYYTDALTIDTIQPNLMFTLNGLSVDFGDIYASLQGTDDKPFSAEALLMAQDDLIYVAEYGGYGVHGYGGDDTIFGSQVGNDALYGDEGHDRLNSYGGNDTLFGGAGDDLLISTSGDNRFDGGAGNDTLQGDTGYFYLDIEDYPAIYPPLYGTNVAAYQGDSTAYTITLPSYYGETATVTDRVTERDGIDQLSRINALEFLDQDIDLDLLTTAAYLPAADMAELATLYIAYFDRAPDAMGLYYWASHLRDGMTLEAISEYFALSPEAGELFPLQGPLEPLILAVYANVLNRAPDPGGVAFWTEALKDGTVTRGGFTLEILRGAAAEPAFGESADVTAQRDADLTYLEAKTALGLYFATERGMSDVDNANAVYDGFTGSTDSLTAGRAVVDAFYAEALDPDTGELLIQMTGVLDDPLIVGEPIATDVPFAPPATYDPLIYI